MSVESIDQGKDYVVNQIKEKAPNINIIKHEWKTTSQGKYNLEIRSDNNIVDKEFKEEELLYCRTKNQFKVAMRIESIVLKLTK